MAKKNRGTVRKLGLGVVAGGLVLGAGSASAAEFGVSAIVQNTLEVRVDQAMSWGILFANTASAEWVSGLKMNASGSVESVAAKDISGTGAAGEAPAFLSLGVATPARGTVVTGVEFTLSLPDHDTSSLTAPADFTDSNAVVLTIDTGDTRVGQFFMVDFIAGDWIGASTDSITKTGSKYVVIPDYTATEVGFGVGATIYTDGSVDQNGYQTGTYEGMFEVTASY